MYAAGRLGQGLTVRQLPAVTGRLTPGQDCGTIRQSEAERGCAYKPKRRLVLCC